MPNITVYDMMAEIYVSAHFRKIRHDNDTGFLMIMGDNIELSYFNDSAKDMLSTLMNNKQCQVKDIFNEITSLYDAPEMQLKNDIVDFLRDMQWKGLISLRVDKTF